MLMMLINKVSVYIYIYIYIYTHVYTIRKNTEAFVVTRKEIGLEVNAEKPMRKLSIWSRLDTRMQDKITT